MHSHIGCICFEFSSVHVFKYVFNPLGSEQAYSHWLHLFDFFHCVLSSVSSNCRPQRIQRRTGCICFDLSPLCVQKWVLKCDLPREYGITLVAFVWFFSAVCFQVPPQIACLIRCVISLVTFVSCPVIIKGIFAMRNIHHYLQFYAFFFAASVRLTRQGKIILIDYFFLTDWRIKVIFFELKEDFLNLNSMMRIWYIMPN